MKTKKTFSTFLSLILTISIFTISLPQFGYAQTAAKTSLSASDLQSRLSKIEARAEKRRKELGIPGMSLAIVKDGKVIYSKGLGYKDFEKKIPMTADTQLAIGSATKAFTGLSVLMSQDEGKLSLDDSPKKYLPYFRINDPKIDEKIQIRDLLAHSSGLNRTDLGWVTGKLNAEEIIKVAGDAKPIAGLREKFLYQNVMFLAAGEIVGKVQNKPWLKFVPERVFQPLGMTNSTMTIKQMKKAKDYSFGYEYNSDTKKTRKMPMRDISTIGPAGSINSSANDMAKWLNFVLNKGKVDGKRLVSENGFKEWIKPHTKITPNGRVSYGFGWFVQSWKGKKVVQHGGNIDGFNSMVAMIPEENLGFVLLTNVSASTLGGEMMQVVWSEILGEQKKAKPESIAKKVDPKEEAGKYRLEQAGVDINVTYENNKLIANVPGQPPYTLEKIAGRRYKLNGAPGFFVTFKDTEAFLEQPQGNVTLKRIDEKKVSAKHTLLPKELIGRYEMKKSKGRIIEIKDVDGKPSLVVGNQPPYALKNRDDGNFGATGLPETYYIKATRDAKNKVAGITMVQPEGEFEFSRVTKKVEKPKFNISTPDLMAKMIDALGGEEQMRKISSQMITFKIDAIHQGIKGYGKIYQKAPNKLASRTTLTALGKKIGWINEYFDGTRGGETFSFGRGDEYTGNRLEDVKIERDFHPYLDWETKYKKVELRRMGKVGDDKVYVVSVQPKKANRYALYISAKTFLPLRRDSVIVSSTSPQKVPTSQYYSDYREVDGIMVPFKTTSSNPGMGDIVTYITKIKNNVKISDKMFRKK